jgi:hypothetical protein
MAETEIAETENLYFQTTDVFGRSPNTPNSYNRRIPKGLFTIETTNVYTCWDCLALKGHNPGLKGFRCVQLHNIWWQQIPIPHSSWEKGLLSGVNTTGFYLKCPVVCVSRGSPNMYIHL